MRRFGIQVLLVVLVAAACAGDDGQSGTSVPPVTTSGADPGGSTTVSTLPLAMVTEFVQDDDGAIIEVEESVAPPATFDALLDFGIDAGLWDELGGLELLLGHAVGAVPASAVPGAEGIVTAEFTELLDRANALAIAGEYSQDQLAGIRRWFELAVPGPETAAMLADTSQRVGIPGFSSFMGPTSTCAPVDPEDFSGWAVVEGCYLMYEESVQGAALRVFFPDWYLEDEELVLLPQMAIEALMASATTFAPLATIGDMDVIFSLVDTRDSDGTLGVANDDATWGDASRGGSCPITVFPNSFSDDFQHTVAHEAWHCVQRENGYPRGVADSTKWIDEGGAEYFASLVYPNRDWVYTFDRSSRTTAVWDMNYPAWIWWQFLGNQTSPRSVADLQAELVHAADGGQSAMAEYPVLFERFVIEFVAGTIADAHGSTLPMANYFNPPMRTVSKGDEGAEYEFSADAFVAARHPIKYEEQLRVMQSDETSTDGRTAMVKFESRATVGEWRADIYPEVRSKCEGDVYYIVAPTVVSGSHTVTVRIDEIEEAVCDPCVLGTWDLDLDSFQAMLMAAMGDSMPSGASFDIGGNYYLSFDDEAVFQEQRAGLTVTVTVSGQSIVSVVDSFSVGEYSADGENMAVMNVEDLFVVVSLGGQGFAQEGSILSGDGTYECRQDDMTVTVTGFQPVDFVRVDKILEPPPIPES